MAGGSEWSKYTPEQRAARSKAQSERCRKMNLARSKEMRTRLAREMGKANKGRKLTEEHRKAVVKWRSDPVKAAKNREKQRIITKKWQAADPEKAEKCHANIRPGNGFKKTASEEDWWARNFKVARHKKRITDTRNKLSEFGLDVIDAQNVSDKYLDQVDDFFAEVW